MYWFCNAAPVLCVIQIIRVCFPLRGVIGDVIADAVQSTVIADDMFEIIALPYFSTGIPCISLICLVTADLFDCIMVGIGPTTGFPNCSVITFCFVFVGAQQGMITNRDVKKGARAPFVEKQRERYQ